MSTRSELNPATGEINIDTSNATFDECMRMAFLFEVAAEDTCDETIEALHMETARLWLRAAHLKRLN